MRADAVAAAHLVLVVAITWGGSRLALRREPNWGAGQLDPVVHYIFTFLLMAGVMATTGTLLWPAWYPAGIPYLTIAVSIVLAVLTGLSVAKSWEWRGTIAGALVIAGGLWLTHPGWETYSLAAAATVIMLFALVRPQFSFWEASALLVLVSGWDAWNLFVTQAAAVAHAAQVDPFYGGNVHDVGLPAMIGLAARLAPLSTYAAAIGIGDLTLPGLLIVAAGRAGKLAKVPQLYRAAMAAYAASLAVVSIASSTTNLAMPVLPFATTAIVAAVTLTAWRTGALRSLATCHLRADRPGVPRKAAAEL